MKPYKEVVAEVLEDFKAPDALERVARVAIKGNGRPADNWSFRNQVLMIMQGTSDARGFNQWKDIGRHVKKGSHAIGILKPCIIPAKDGDGRTVKGKNGRSVGECVGFKVIPVFRLQDTDGKPLPEYNPPNPPPLIDVAKRFGLEVKYGPACDAWWGYFNAGNREIFLGTFDAAVYFHELAHAAHDRVEKLKDLPRDKKEIVAEFTAAILLKVYGARDKASGTAYDYIKAYAGEGGDVVRACMKVLGLVERVLGQIFDKDIDAEVDVEAVAVEVPA